MHGKTKVLLNKVIVVVILQALIGTQSGMAVLPDFVPSCTLRGVREAETIVSAGLKSTIGNRGAVSARHKAGSPQTGVRGRLLQTIVLDAEQQQTLQPQYPGATSIEVYTDKTYQQEQLQHKEGSPAIIFLTPKTNRAKVASALRRKLPQLADAKKKGGRQEQGQGGSGRPINAQQQADGPRLKLEAEYTDMQQKLSRVVELSRLSIPRDVMEAVQVISDARNLSEFMAGLQQLSLPPNSQEQIVLSSLGDFFSQRYEIQMPPVILTDTIVIMDGVGAHFRNLSEYWRTLFLEIMFLEFHPRFTGCIWVVRDGKQTQRIVLMKRNRDIGEFMYYLLHEFHHLRQRLGRPRVKEGFQVSEILGRFLREGYAEYATLQDLHEVARIGALKPLDPEAMLGRFLSADFEVKSPYNSGLGFIRKVREEGKATPITMSAVEEAALNDNHVPLCDILGRQKWKLFTGIADTLSTDPTLSENRQYDVLVTTSLLAISAASHTVSHWTEIRRAFTALPQVFSALKPSRLEPQIFAIAAGRKRTIEPSLVTTMLIEIYKFICEKDNEIVMAQQLSMSNLQESVANSIVDEWLDASFDGIYEMALRLKRQNAMAVQPDVAHRQQITLESRL